MKCKRRGKVRDDVTMRPPPVGASGLCDACFEDSWEW